MQLLIKQRVFSWSDTYDIYDEQGNQKYFVKNELISLGHRLHVYDAAHNEIGFIKQKLFCFSAMTNVFPIFLLILFLLFILFFLAFVKGIFKNYSVNNLPHQWPIPVTMPEFHASDHQIQWHRCHPSSGFFYVHERLHCMLHTHRNPSP